MTAMCCQVCVSPIVSGSATETRAPFDRRPPMVTFQNPLPSPVSLFVPLKNTHISIVNFTDP
jgi:hypothetical protein